MMEQRTKFTMLGLKCEFVGELQQDLESMSDVQNGLVQLLFISPESLLSNPQWREMLRIPVYQERVVALVVDEAHCIAMWYVSSCLIFCIIHKIKQLLTYHIELLSYVLSSFFKG